LLMDSVSLLSIRNTTHLESCAGISFAMGSMGYF
jgi:hypothetical protein